MVVILGITAAIVILRLAAVILSLSIGAYSVSRRSEAIQPAVVNTNPATEQRPATPAPAENGIPFLQAAQGAEVPVAVRKKLG